MAAQLVVVAPERRALRLRWALGKERSRPLSCWRVRKIALGKLVTDSCRVASFMSVFSLISSLRGSQALDFASVFDACSCFICSSPPPSRRPPFLLLSLPSNLLLSSRGRVKRGGTRSGLFLPFSASLNLDPVAQLAGEAGHFFGEPFRGPAPEGATARSSSRRLPGPVGRFPGDASRRGSHAGDRIALASDRVSTLSSLSAAGRKPLPRRPGGAETEKPRATASSFPEACKSWSTRSRGGTLPRLRTRLAPSCRRAGVLLQLEILRRCVGIDARAPRARLPAPRKAARSSSSDGALSFATRAISASAPISLVHPPSVRRRLLLHHFSFSSCRFRAPSFIPVPCRALVPYLLRVGPSLLFPLFVSAHFTLCSLLVLLVIRAVAAPVRDDWALPAQPNCSDRFAGRRPSRLLSGTTCSMVADNLSSSPPPHRACTDLSCSRNDEKRGWCMGLFALRCLISDTRSSRLRFH